MLPRHSERAIDDWIPGYQLCPGSSLDRAKLLKFMHRTYQELYPEQELGHLAKTVEQYFSSKTPVWWVEFLETPPETWETPENSSIEKVVPSLLPSQTPQNLKATVACLWVGNALDQASGERHAHIFLLYVAPEHRQRGIGSALIRIAEEWARVRGDCKIGLQVFQANRPALNLYQKLGYQTESLWMVKSLADH